MGEGGAQVFYTLARGIDVYRRYLVVAALLVCAAIIGGLIQQRIRRSLHTRQIYKSKAAGDGGNDVPDHDTRADA